MKKSIFLTMLISFGLTFMFSGCSSDEATKVLESLTQNTAPTANTQTITVTQDSSDNNITLSGNDTDEDTLTYTVETNTTHGTLSGTAPNLKYTPTIGYDGNDSLTFKVNDGTVDSETVSVNIVINPPENELPVPKAGADQTITVGDDVTLDAGSSTDDGTIESYIWSEGTTLLNSTVSFTKTDFTVGTHTITLTVTDNQGATATDEVVVTVNAPANLVPVSLDVNVTTGENVELNITLSASDGDATDTLTYSIVTSPSNGTLSGITDNNITYTPNTDYNGTDSFTYKVNDGTVDSNTATVNITINDVPTVITHNGTTYDTVTSPYTGKVWLDRNLGASQVCTALDDSACYGDHYQWGRNYDGHQESNSTTTSTQATDINSAGSSFIKGSDWTSADSNGSLRTANWSKTDGSSVCPTGFRVPTTTELSAETLNSTDCMSNRVDAFSNFLKLPSAGYRNNYDGSVYGQGSYGIVWSSSVSGSNSYYLYFDSYDANTYYGGYRASGFSVRCLKD